MPGAAKSMPEAIYIMCVCVCVFLISNNFKVMATARQAMRVQRTPYSCQILRKLGFCRHVFSKNFQISTFMKIRSVGAELFHAYEQTENDETE
jgi:hypothetical protein